MRYLLAALIVIIGTTSHAGEPRVSIQVGQDAKTIVCRVPQDASNRLLYIGIVGQLSSERQLDGADAPITHRLALPRLVDCQTEEPFEQAFCELVRRDGASFKHEIINANIRCRGLF